MPIVLHLPSWFDCRAEERHTSAELEKHLADAEIIISTPFHPAYLTKERLGRAKKLQLALTAGEHTAQARRL